MSDLMPTPPERDELVIVQGLETLPVPRTWAENTCSVILSDAFAWGEYDHWNSPDVLPPVGCPIVLRIGCAVVQAERTAHIERRDREMTYKLPTGQELVGRYEWTYR